MITFKWAPYFTYTHIFRRGLRIVKNYEHVIEQRSTTFIAYRMLVLCSWVWFTQRNTYIRLVEFEWFNKSNKEHTFYKHTIYNTQLIIHFEETNVRFETFRGGYKIYHFNLNSVVILPSSFETLNNQLFIPFKNQEEIIKLLKMSQLSNVYQPDICF